MSVCAHMGKVDSPNIKSQPEYPSAYPTTTFNCWIFCFVFLCSVDHASLYNLVNETNLVHYLVSVYFVNFIYNLYMFWTSPSPSSGGITLFMRHLIFVILNSWLSGVQDPAHQTASYT